MKSKLDDEESRERKSSHGLRWGEGLDYPGGLWWKSLEKQAVPYLMGKY